MKNCSFFTLLFFASSFSSVGAVTIAVPFTTFSQTSNVSGIVPDNDAVGLVNSMQIERPALSSIVGVEVRLEFSGGWNGDLYALLTHSTGYSVLLNRVGRSASLLSGSASSGMIVDLSDAASTDIHTGLPDSGVNLAGFYQPDGRESDPLEVLDTDARTALLSSFAGLDPNGTWTLFVADQAAGDESTLESWTLTLVAVPEPSVIFFSILGGVGSLFRRSRTVRSLSS